MILITYRPYATNVILKKAIHDCIITISIVVIFLSTPDNFVGENCNTMPNDKTNEFNI